MPNHADAPDPQPPETNNHTLVELLAKKVVGQPAAMEYIVPYLQMYQAASSCFWVPRVPEKRAPLKRSPRCCTDRRRPC